MRIYGLAALAMVGGLALAGCGSSGSSTQTASPVGSQASGYGSSAPMPTASPTTAAATTSATSVHTAMTSLGNVLVDADGHTLYGLTKDADGSFQCVGDCATAWPPVTVKGTALPAGLDSKLFSVVTRPDGSHQLKAGKWPLYRFAQDAKAGDVNGQGVGGFFFAVSPDGKLHK